MRRMADQYFRKFGKAFTFPDVPGEKSQLKPLERKSLWEERERNFKNHSRGKNIPENLTATYWG